MREFKFRIWDAEMNDFYYFDLNNLDYSDLLALSNGKLSQFTGLKDKNGKKNI